MTNSNTFTATVKYGRNIINLVGKFLAHHFILWDYHSDPRIGIGTNYSGTGIGISIYSMFLRLFLCNVWLASVSAFVSINNPTRPSPQVLFSTTAKWFPTRIQEDVDYIALVQSLYLRHIVVETMETAQLALEQYLIDTSSKDPFGDLAAKLSACSESRNEGGKVGWVDVRKGTPSPLLPIDVFEQLVQLAPKTGDVHILASESSGQVHLVRVEELLIQHNPNLKDDKPTRIGSHRGQNAVVSRSKLKGQGVMPNLPTFTAQKKYFIQTNGCQMNVADSERLAGILENQMQLTPAVTAEQADVVLFNTCSIRDHAEQKLYDLLGPFCARKRKGEEIALIVTGCVAQQEGEELLRKGTISAGILG